jgi:hypothetical protein
LYNFHSRMLNQVLESLCLQNLHEFKPPVTLEDDVIGQLMPHTFLLLDSEFLGQLIPQHLGVSLNSAYPRLLLAASSSDLLIYWKVSGGRTVDHVWLLWSCFGCEGARR